MARLLLILFVDQNAILNRGILIAAPAHTRTAMQSNILLPDHIVNACPLECMLHLVQVTLGITYKYFALVKQQDSLPRSRCITQL